MESRRHPLPRRAAHWPWEETVSDTAKKAHSPSTAAGRGLAKYWVAATAVAVAASTGIVSYLLWDTTMIGYTAVVAAMLAGETLSAVLNGYRPTVLGWTAAFAAASSAVYATTGDWDASFWAAGVALCSFHADWQTGRGRR